MDELLPEPQHVGLSSDDDGHGVLRGLVQGTVCVNEKLGHLDREYLQAWHSQGASARVPGRKGVGKSKARTSVASSPRSAGSLYTQTSVDLNLGKII